MASLYFSARGEPLNQCQFEARLVPYYTEMFLQILVEAVGN